MRELIVDNFAGGGGASTGIRQATGRDVDIAINHDPVAVAMHIANHPGTRHYCESVWDIDPREVAEGKPVALCWLSPDCKHFSKAKGGKPVEKSIRGLAWVAVRWAATVRPRVIILENVEEFVSWGPLMAMRDKETGRILKKQPRFDEDGDEIGFDLVVSEPGEEVPPELRMMVPDPKQKGRTFRAFVNAFRRQGYQVEWRELRACDYGAPTIRKRLFLIARNDGLPIVWPEPTHGDPASEAVKSGRLLPWRTAAEIIDWSLPCPSIFERKRPLAENTMKRIARGIFKFVINNPEPFILNYKFKNEPESVNRPLSTITSVNGHYVVAPTLIQTGYGEREGQLPRVLDLDKPLGTVVAGGQKHALVAAFLAQYHSYTTDGARGQELTRPLLTQDTSNRYALVTSHLIKMKGTNIGQPVDQPLQTITAGGFHFGEVRAFLMKYYGTAVGQDCREPLHTVTSKDRIGLVTVAGVDYQIVDIGMRMLEPHELFAAQGFPADYIIDHDHIGNRYPKSAQVARCGNAVPPPFAEALTRANLPELCGVTPKRAAVQGILW